MAWQASRGPCGGSGWLPAQSLPHTAHHALFANPRLPLLTCGLLGVLLATAAADIQSPPRPRTRGERQVQRRGEGPATATPQEEVQVEAGSSAAITLHGEGEAGKSINFSIRTPPRHGTISGEPTRVTRNSVAVLYVPTPGDDSTDDEFSFTAWVAGGAVSAPQTVRLRLLPSAPFLAATPTELDFGAVKVGEDAQALLTLENRGGSEASGHVEPPPPFVVEGPADYHLGRGGKQTFRIVFRPRGEQVFNEGLHFRFEGGGGVRLVGTGLGGPSSSLVSSTVGTASSVVKPADPGGHENGLLTVYPVVTAAPPPAATPAPAKAGAAVRQTRVGRPEAENNGAGAGQGLNALGADTTSVPVNEAAVRAVQVNAVGSSTVDLSWRQPAPKPASYRLELRYIVVDDDQARADWRPYAQVEINVGHVPVTAHVRGLPAGGLQMFRVVAVDAIGNLAEPSPMITVMLKPASTWWRPTLLKALVLALLVCLALVARRKWEERQMLAEIDASRQRANAEAGVAWRT